MLPSNGWLVMRSIDDDGALAEQASDIDVLVEPNAADDDDNGRSQTY